MILETKLTVVRQCLFFSCVFLSILYQSSRTVYSIR